ncbi:hypothetical protein B0H14DRAFT_2560552 [Mycena olivaceomarginata]|nr:hypothetical protein B0H14DRAFT_2560552 [Mycena olivaceomarginata]
MRRHDIAGFFEVVSSVASVTIASPKSGAAAEERQPRRPTDVQPFMEQVASPPSATPGSVGEKMVDVGWMDPKANTTAPTATESPTNFSSVPASATTTHPSAPSASVQARRTWTRSPPRLRPPHRHGTRARRKTGTARGAAAGAFAATIHPAGFATGVGLNWALCYHYALDLVRIFGTVHIKSGRNRQMENSVELIQVLAQIIRYQYLANSHQIQLQCLAGIYDHALDLTAIKGSAQYCIGTGPNLHPKGKSELAPNSFKSLIPRPFPFSREAFVLNLIVVHAAPAVHSLYAVNATAFRIKVSLQWKNLHMEN